MSDTRSDLQFWQMVAGAVGTGLAALIVGVGRRAGSLARREPQAAPAGDALQREILAAIREGAEETRSLRGDWQAKRDADEARRREQRDGLDDQLDDLRHGQRIARTGNNEIKVLLRELIERQPERIKPSNPAGGRE